MKFPRGHNGIPFWVPSLLAMPLTFASTRVAFVLGGGPPSLFWPTNGVSMILLNSTTSLQSFIFAACACAVGLAIAQVHILDTSLAFKLAGANSVEFVLGSLLMRKMVDLRSVTLAVSRTRSLVIILTFPVLLSSVFGAALGATVLSETAGAEYPSAALEWFIGDASGNFVTLYIGYVLLGHAHRTSWNDLKLWLQSKIGILSVVQVGIVIMCLLTIFSIKYLTSSLAAPLLLVVFPVTGYLAGSVPQVASAGTGLVLVLVATISTNAGRGPIVAILDVERSNILVTLQVLLLVNMILTGIMAVSQAQRLESEKKVLLSIEEKLSFFTHVSHEFRTPLSIVVGFTEELLTEENLTSRARDDLNHVFTAALGMSEIVNDLLFLFRMDVKSIPLLQRPVSTSKFIDMLRLTAERLCKGKSQPLSWDIDLPLTMKFDPGRMKQVMSNLISNAVKYTPPYTSISISGHLIKEEATGIPMMELGVHDSGPGISEEDQKRLFERFFRCDTTGAEGSGLGLTICQNIAGAMGGKLSVKSTVGHGSSFYLTVPAVVLDSMSVTTISTSVGESSNYDCSFDKEDGSGNTSQSNCDNMHKEGMGEYRLNILVAEDSVPNQKLIKRILENQGHTAEVAVDGQDALDMLTVNKGKKFDLLIADLGMPRKTGLEVLEELRASAPEEGLQTLPVIICSGHALGSHRLACQKAGCNAFTTKPFLAKDVHETVQRVYAEYLERKGTRGA